MSGFLAKAMGTGLSVFIERNPWRWSIGVDWSKALLCNAACCDERPHPWRVRIRFTLLFFRLVVLGPRASR